MAKRSKRDSDSNEEDGGKAVHDDDEKEEKVKGDGEETEEGKKKRKRKRKRSRKAQKSEGNEDGDSDGDGDGDDNVNDNQEDDTSRTVFVEGIPYDATPERVAECLQQHAKIEREDMVDLRFPVWQDTGRMRGYGHVVFATEEIFDKVMKAAKSGQKLWLGKRYLNLQPAKPKGMGGVASSQQAPNPNQTPTKTIMIKNLDYAATEDDIKEVMEKQFGEIVDGGVRIARNYDNRQSKGFGYVEFKDLDSAKKAMERQRKQPSKRLYILQRACILDYDEGRIKGSFKTSTGRLWSREHKLGHGDN